MKKSKRDKIKLLIDERVLGKTTKLLKKEGFSITTVQELGKTSATNGRVIKIAEKEKAIIISNDLDFGNLMLYPLGSHKCIIVLRPRLINNQAIGDVHNILIRLLNDLKPEEIKKSLIIVDRNKYRLKKL